MTTRQLNAVIMTCGLFLAVCNAACGEDRRARIFEAYPPTLQARLEARDRELAAQVPEAERDGLEAVVTKGKVWSAGRAITVAFRGGDSALHKKLADSASIWTQHGHFTLDFGLNPATGRYRKWSPFDQQFTADIRISFNLEGYWSLVGKDSRSAVVSGPGEPSMNFEGFASALPDDWEEVVLHEFGHALGLQHEHQHPDQGCDFRWEDDPDYVQTRDSLGQFIKDSAGRRPGIYTVLGGPPNDWPQATVDFNLRKLTNSSAFQSGPFDSQSIMLYYFDSWMFTGGENSPCFTGARNGVLSTGDINSIKLAYPAPEETQALQQLAEVQQRYEALASAIDAPPQSAAAALIASEDVDNEISESYDRSIQEKLAAIRPKTAELDALEATPPERMALGSIDDQPVDRQELERVVQDPNFLPAEFVVIGAQRQSSVGRISCKATFTHPQAGAFFPGDGWGTGFLVAPTILMTNNHVLDAVAFARDKVRVEFNYQRRLTDDELVDRDSYDFDPDSFFYTNAALDFTLVRVKPKPPAAGSPVGTAPVPPGDRWGFYRLADARGVTAASYFSNMQLNIVQHPAGRPKEVAIHENRLDDLLPSHVRYTTDTEGGSSGSPVFDNRWTLMALHHSAGEQLSNGKWKNNEGVRIDKIIANVMNSLDVPASVKTELGF